MVSKLPLGRAAAAWLVLLLAPARLAAGQLNFDCSSHGYPSAATVSSWSSEQKVWCCQNENVGCSDLSDGQQQDPACGPAGRATLDFRQIAHNNLGGKGPDPGFPHAIQYRGVAAVDGRCVMMVVMTPNEQTYQPESPDQNGVTQNTQVAKLNLISGARSDLKVIFVDCDTQQPARLSKFNISFYAVNEPTERKVTVRGYSSYRLDNPSLFDKSYTDFGTTFSASQSCQAAVGTDACALTFVFDRTNQFEVTLEAPPSGRSLGEPFYFSGSVCQSATLPHAVCSAKVCGPGWILQRDVAGYKACAGGSCTQAECCAESYQICSQDICGFGEQLKPREQLPDVCESLICSQKECCEPALDELARINKDLYTAVSTCSGEERQWSGCDQLPECHACIPKDCSFGSWGDWSPSGGCTGLCQRTRTPGTNNACGQPCDGPTLETVSRLDDPFCYPLECRKQDADCAWAEWTEWSQCDEDCTTCMRRQSYRKRQIAVRQQGMGQPCSGIWNETRPCKADDAVDCEMSQWAEWTTCSRSCGTGFKTRMRRVLRPAAWGGKPCGVDGSYGEGIAMRQTFPCNQEHCGKPTDCVVGDWSGWSQCVLGAGWQKFRSRAVLASATNGGRGCSEDLNETEACPKPEPRQPEACRFSPWEDWGDCSATCAGQMERQRGVYPINCTLNAASRGNRLRETKPCGSQTCWDDECVLSDWSWWSNCSSACGTGVSTRGRAIVSKGEARGCMAALEELRSCQDSECQAVNCQWGDWEQWESCTTSCGGGTKRRGRAIEVPPRYGGLLCPQKLKSQVTPCNTQGCDVCIDGEWGDWGGWSKCTASCAPAFKSRHRSVAKHANRCGAPALGVEDEYEMCAELNACEPDLDCQVSEWTAWSACSNECFGVKEREREISQMASGAGRPCFNESLKEVTPCNPEQGQQPSDVCGPDPERACKLSVWSAWSKCTATCAGGQMKRSRNVLSPAANDGPPCRDALEELAPCNTQQCGDEHCVDCQWEDWAEWGNCTKCGGQRFRARDVKTLPNHCGEPCDSGAAKETEKCAACTEQFFCAWSEWTAMGQCSQECGYQTQSRQRQLTLSVSDLGSGNFFQADKSSPCSGNQVDMATCPFRPCEDQCVPQACALSEWSEWSEPSCEQLCERRRKVAMESSCDGAPCEGALMETKECAKNCSLPVDCAFGAWGSWTPTECVRENGQQLRHRSVQREASNGGAACSGAVKETVPCFDERSNVQECELSAWSPWTKCSESCGGGLQTRGRRVEVPAGHGGRSCVGALEEIEACNEVPCRIERVDCVLGAWQPWSECDDEAMKYRERRIEEEPSATGFPCSGSLLEALHCNQTVDCVASEWTRWDECDKTCSGGQTMRQRAVLTNPRNGGKKCPEELMQARGCNTQPCSDVDCVVAAWTPWSSCSTTCGNGLEARRRDFQPRRNEDGEGCRQQLSEARPCNLEECQCVDCLWAEWFEWSGCSAPCDGGQRTRDRHIIKAPQPGCKPCEAKAKEEMEPCNTQRCHDKVCTDGQWADWTDWEACSASCEGGETWRVRSVKVEANDCGVPAVGLSMEHKSCNEKIACTPNIDCQWEDWSAWTACSSQCEGIKRRGREVRIHGEGKGQFCEGATVQIWPCEIESGVLDFKEPSMYLDLSRLTTNNFGGGGPGEASVDGQGQALPGVLSFSQVAKLPELGTTVDLIIKPTTLYQPCQVEKNGVEGHTFVAINVPSGQRVAVDFELVDSKTGAVVQAKELVIKAFDMDAGASGKSTERIHAKGYADYFVTSDSSVSVEKELSSLTAFSATGYGTDDDDPTDPSSTLPAQERKTVSFLYRDVGSAQLSLEVTDGGFCKTFLFAVRACFGGDCKANPCANTEKRPVDCKLGDWHGWAECDSSCGIGQKVRSREIIMEPAFGGEPCDSGLSETVACDLHPCEEACAPVDCAWEDWNEWGACDKCGGQMRRYRHIATHPSCGGRACQGGAAEEIVNCTRTCHGNRFCTWHEWGEWGGCSASCDQGLRSRARFLKEVSTPMMLAEARAKEASGGPLELEQKFASLHARTEHIRSNRVQVILMSFTGGCMSLFAAVVAFRSCASGSSQRAAVRSRTAPMDLIRSDGYQAAPSESSQWPQELRDVSVA